jgi:hypothetical protein
MASSPEPAAHGKHKANNENVMRDFDGFQFNEFVAFILNGINFLLACDRGYKWQTRYE